MDQDQRKRAATAWFVAETHRRLNAYLMQPTQHALVSLEDVCVEFADHLKHGQCVKPVLPV
jgi:hypothetical protein